MIAADLIAWLRLLALTGSLAKAEPKALRYRTTARPGPADPQRTTTTPAATRPWPWTDDIIAVFARIGAIPHPLNITVRHDMRNPETRSPAAPAGTACCPPAEITEQPRTQTRSTSAVNDRG